MRFRLSKQTIAETVTMLLVFLFLYTGLSKYVEHDSFVFSLSRSILLKWAAGFIAATLPGFEIALAILLIIPRTRLLSLLISFVLLLLFATYLSYMVLFSPHLPCGCGGIISHLSWKGHIFLNLGCSLLAWIGIRNQKKLSNNDTQHTGMRLSV